MMRLWIVLMIVLSTVPVDAQPAPQDRREKIKQRIRALRAYTLTEQLDLDEATAAKLFPALAKYDEEFDKLLAARAELQRRLNEAGGLKDPKAIDDLINEAVANQKAIWDTEERRLAQLRKILTPGQTARVLVVLPAMERKIQNQLKRAAQKPGAPAAAAGPRPPRPGDLTKNPFEKSSDNETVLDPFSGPRPKPRPMTPAEKAEKAEKAKRAKHCDPFNSVHGCTK